MKGLILNKADNTV